MNQLAFVHCLLYVSHHENSKILTRTKTLICDVGNVLDTESTERIKTRTNLTNQNKIMNKKYLRTQVPTHKQQHELE